MIAEERAVVEQRVKNAFSDKVFVQELFALKIPEDVQRKLQDKGIILSLDEVRMIPRALQNAMNHNDELTEKELAAVAAGSASFVVAAQVVDFFKAYGVYPRTWEKWM